MIVLFHIAEGLGISISEIFNEENTKLYIEMKKEYEIDKIINEDFCRIIKRKRVISLMKNYRKKKHISQYILSLKTGIPKTVISNFEYG